MLEFVKIRKSPKALQHDQDKPIGKSMNLKEKTKTTAQNMANKSNTIQVQVQIDDRLDRITYGFFMYAFDVCNWSNVM